MKTLITFISIAALCFLSADEIAPLVTTGGTQSFVGSRAITFYAAPKKLVAVELTEQGELYVETRVDATVSMMLGEDVVEEAPVCERQYYVVKAGKIVKDRLVKPRKVTPAATVKQAEKIEWPSP